MNYCYSWARTVLLSYTLFASVKHFVEAVAVDVTHQVTDQKNKVIDLQVSWNGIRDAESGIKASEFCLGTIQQSCINSLLPAGRATLGTIHSFRPKPCASYYVIVVVHNGAGLVTTLTSPQLSFDTTPPSPGAVIDWYGKDIDYTNSTDTIAVEWSRFEDSESEVTKCRWFVTQKTVSENGTHFGNGTELFHQSVNNSGRATRTGKNHLNNIVKHNHVKLAQRNSIPNKSKYQK